MECIVPYQHNQNPVERYMRILENSTRAQMLTANAPPRFFATGVINSAFLRNHWPNNRHGRKTSPLEELYGETSGVSRCHALGCLAISPRHPDREFAGMIGKGKTSQRAILGIYLCPPHTFGKAGFYIYDWVTQRPVLVDEYGLSACR